MIGYRDVGAGAPVVLLHGLGGDAGQSLGLLPDGTPGRRIAPELPGHGATELLASTELSFEAFADAVADVLDHLAPGGSLPVAGVSMGAGVALALATRRPDLVERLILIRPSHLDTSPVPNLAAFGEIAELLESGHRGEAGVERFTATGTYRTIVAGAPAMAASLLGQFTRPLAAERWPVLRELATRLPLPSPADYRRIGVPALVLGAPGDPVHDIAIAREWARRIPGARFAELPRKDLDAAVHTRALQAAVAAELGSALVAPEVRRD